MSASEDSVDIRRVGAYGLRITGIRKGEHLLVPADPAWPSLEVVVERGHAGSESHMDDDRAILPLMNGGRAAVDRKSGRAVFTLPHAPTSDEIVHPCLAPAAAAMSHWLGREPFHAGAFVGKSGAWGLLAGREGGKSSTLAQLALEGVPVVCDDVLVLDETTAFAGPRAIDLRSEPAHALGVGRELGVVGTRERWRLGLDAIEGVLPLQGWVCLAWGEALSLDPLPVEARLRRLASHRAVSLTPRDPGLLLRLSALPVFELRRPRRWSSLGAVVSALSTLP